MRQRRGQRGVSRGPVGRRFERGERRHVVIEKIAQRVTQARLRVGNLSEVEGVLDVLERPQEAEDVRFDAPRGRGVLFLMHGRPSGRR